MLKRRQEAQSDATKVFVTPENCKVGKQFPQVVEFLTCEKWPDGEERDTGTIMLVYDDGKLKLWLCDKDAGLSCWVTAQSLTEALQRACKIIDGAEADWRHWEDSRKSKKRGRA